MNPCEEDFHHKTLSLLGPRFAPKIGEITDRLPTVAICIIAQVLVENAASDRSVARSLVVSLVEVLQFLVDIAHHVAQSLVAGVQGLIDGVTGLDKSTWMAILVAILEPVPWYIKIARLFVRVVGYLIGRVIGAFLGLPERSNCVVQEARARLDRAKEE